MTDREQERAAVVAWLREEAATDTGTEEHILWWAAFKIERGDHLTDRPAP
jgi:hypothetical protein